MLFVVSPLKIPFLVSPFIQKWIRVFKEPQ